MPPSPDNPGPTPPPVAPVEVLPPGYQGYGYAPPGNQQGTHVLAVIALVCGLLGVVSLCCCCCWPAPAAAVVCGHLALSQIKANPWLRGHGLALAGLILGYLGMALIVVNMVIGLTMPSKKEDVEQLIEQVREDMRKYLPAEAPEPAR